MPDQAISRGPSVGRSEGESVTIGYQAYQTNAVQTASPEQLVVMLYDGCLRFLRRAHAAAENGAKPQCTQAISRATAIIMELNATLDMERGGEIATNLRSIYLFLNRHLVDSATECNADRIAQAIPMIADLRGAFAEASKQIAAA
jgi:flagellar protein FliS